MLDPWLVRVDVEEKVDLKSFKILLKKMNLCYLIDLKVFVVLIVKNTFICIVRSMDEQNLEE